MPRAKLRKFKDIHSLIKNATDDEFERALKNLQSQNELKACGWLIQERLRVRGYMRM